MPRPSETTFSTISNPEAERDLLGVLMFNNDTIAMVQDFLRPDHFHEPVHQRIYAAMLDMFIAGDLASPVTMKNRFDADGALAGIGGAKYLVHLVANSSPLLDVAQVGKVIYRLWQRRQMREWCEEAIACLSEEDAITLPDEIGARLVGRFNDMDSLDRKREVVDGVAMTEKALLDLDGHADPYSTGMSRLDKAMGGGLFPGFTYGFGARKKVGKTILAGTLSYNLDQAGVRHLFIAGEMGGKQIHQRLLARHAGVSNAAFRLKGMQNGKFLEGVGDFGANRGRNILYQNAPGLTFDDLKQYMSRAVYRLKVKGVILDYWQLVGGAQPRESEAKHLDRVAQWIADFCREHGIWSVVFAQINQDGNTRGGEGLRLACDQMYQIHRPEDNPANVWVEMMDTRYTEWMNIGSETDPGWQLVSEGPYFREYPSGGQYSAFDERKHSA